VKSIPLQAERLRQLKKLDTGRACDEVATGVEGRFPASGKAGGYLLG